jgi:hypothetical protein
LNPKTTPLLYYLPAKNALLEQHLPPLIQNQIKEHVFYDCRSSLIVVLSI